MSVRMMACVWQNSIHSSSDLLLLLAIADFANDDGVAFPAVSTLAEKCRMSVRNANLILARLRKSGELMVRRNEGPKGTNLYQLVLKTSSGLERTSLDPEVGIPKPLKHTSDKPLVNHQEPSSKRGSRLSSDWILPDTYRSWAMEDRGWSSVQCDRVAERFRDYWLAAKDAKAAKTDWFTTWQNWCRRERIDLLRKTPRVRAIQDLTNIEYGKGGAI